MKQKKTSANDRKTVCRVIARLTPTEANKINQLMQTNNSTVSAVIRQLIQNA